MIEDQLLQKYFEGTCTPEELATVLEWLNNDQEDHTPLRAMMLRRWENEMGDMAKVEWKEETPVLRARRWVLRYSVAAAVIGVLLVSAWLFNQHRMRSLAGEWKSLTNGSTKMKFCLLPDSSKVWLDPKSTISWRMPLDEGAERSVRIEGQAFFDVRKDVARPFVAYSGPLVTRVLGTAFNIEAYADENDIRISLVNGKIAVGHGKEEVLKPGEMLTYEKEAETVRKAPLKMADLNDWTSGHIVFSEVRVKTALERLARLYNFHLQYEEGVHLENERFSTVFTREETPVQMIRNILFITPYTYKIVGDHDVEIIHK